MIFIYFLGHFFCFAINSNPFNVFVFSYFCLCVLCSVCVCVVCCALNIVYCAFANRLIYLIEMLETLEIVSFCKNI